MSDEKSQSNTPPDRRWESLRWLDYSLDVALESAREVADRCPEYDVDLLVIRHLTIASEAVELMFMNEREATR